LNAIREKGEERTKADSGPRINVSGEKTGTPKKGNEEHQFFHVRLVRKGKKGGGLGFHQQRGKRKAIFRRGGGMGIEPAV